MFPIHFSTNNIADNSYINITELILIQAIFKFFLISLVN